MNTKDLSKQIISKSEIFSEVLSICSGLLKNNPIAEDARKYINERCSDYYQKEFNFGYFPKKSELHYLIDRMENGEKKLESVGLLYKKDFLTNGIIVKKNSLQLENNNLIMPYKNIYGDIIALVGRTLLPKDQQNNISKYKNTTFIKGNHLFGINKSKKAILQKDAVIIVEGQFDLISCYRNGYYNIVAVGCANLSKKQFYILKRYTNNFYFLFDNDDAGRKGFEKAKERYSNSASINKIDLPEPYHDIDEYLNNSSNHDILNF